MPVVQMAAIDQVLRAAADPTRRRVIEMLARQPSAVSELASAFDMALPSFLQHLKVLEQSGLVRSRKLGRVRTYTLVPQRLQVLDDWMLQQRHLWEQLLGQFDDHLISMSKKEG